MKLKLKGWKSWVGLVGLVLCEGFLRAVDAPALAPIVSNYLEPLFAGLLGVGVVHKLANMEAAMAPSGTTPEQPK